MLQPSSHRCGCGIQPILTSNHPGNPLTTAPGTNAGASQATEGEESDDVDPDLEDEDSEECDSDFWYWDKSLDPDLWDTGSDADTEDLDKNEEDADSDTLPTMSPPTECGIIIGQQDESEAPLTKKAKASHPVAASSRDVRRKTSLSLLPSMPLDILFEIFSHLSPLDIISLSHSSKVFRETLSSPAGWKAVRKRFSAPDGPDWMSEEAWAELLFGHKCQSCGESDTQGVDFLLLKRVCFTCKRAQYVLETEVEKRHPSFDFVVLLVPSTRSTAWSSGSYYWKSDLDAMVNKLAALKKDADPQVLPCFMQERKRRLQCILQNERVWSTSHRQILAVRAQEAKDIEKKRLQQIKEKFRELGYIEEDLEFLGPRHCRGHGKIRLTTKIWNRIRPMLEPQVQGAKAERLEMQFATLRHTRREVLAARYKEFQGTLHPSQWKYLPSTMEITAFEAFSRHIEADVEIEVDGTTFDDTFLELPSLLVAATKQRKTTLRALMASTPKEDGEIGGDPIDPATAVFKCNESHRFPRPINYLFGWDEIASHHCLPEDLGYHAVRTTPPVLTYIPEIAIIVKKLAQLLGLDAATATAADFDKKDKRFTCEACQTINEKGRRLQTGYTWRHLAIHLEASKLHNPNLYISIIDDTAADEVKQCERKDGKWNTAQWTCSRCPEYLGNLQARQSIVEHLSDSHGISDPSEPTDLFFFERCKTDWVTKPRFSVLPSEGEKFQCLMCGPKIQRRFKLVGVQAHLRAKHDVLAPQNGVHLAFG